MSITLYLTRLSMFLIYHRTIWSRQYTGNSQVLIYNLIIPRFDNLIILQKDGKIVI